MSNADDTVVNVAAASASSPENEALRRELERKKIERDFIIEELDIVREEALTFDASEFPLELIASKVASFKEQLQEREDAVKQLTSEIHGITAKLRINLSPEESAIVRRRLIAASEAKFYIEELGQWATAEEAVNTRSRSASDVPDPDQVQPEPRCSLLTSTPMNMPRPLESDSIRFRYSFVDTSSLAGPTGSFLQNAQQAPQVGTQPPLQAAPGIQPPTQGPAPSTPLQPRASPVQGRHPSTFLGASSSYLSVSPHQSGSQQLLLAQAPAAYQAQQMLPAQAPAAYQAQQMLPAPAPAASQAQQLPSAQAPAAYQAQQMFPAPAPAASQAQQMLPAPVPAAFQAQPILPAQVQATYQGQSLFPHPPAAVPIATRTDPTVVPLVQSLQAAGPALQAGSSGYAHRTHTDPFSLGRKARQVPKFGGDTTKFREWQQLFKVFVDDTPAPTIEKFNLLRTSLTGKAKDAIAHLQWEEAHYVLAKDILRERFGDSKLAQKSHIAELDRLVERGQIVNSRLEAFSETLSLHVRALLALGLTYAELSTTTAQRVLRCLPLELRERYIIKLADRKLTDPLITDLEFMLIFLEHTVKVRREAEWGNSGTNANQRESRRPFSSTSGSSGTSRNRNPHNAREPPRNNYSFFAAGSKQTKPQSPRSRPDSRQGSQRPQNASSSSVPPRPPTVPTGRPFSTAAGSSSSGSNSQNINRSCIFCEGPHEAFRCKQVLSHDERLERIQARNGCPTCLKRIPHGKNCKDGPKKNCPSCQGRHYLIMCKKTRADGANLHIASATTAILPSTVHELEASPDVNEPDILLQMAVVWIEAGGVRSLARILLDTGSHRSYITTQAVRQIESSPIASVRATLRTLGNATTTMDTYLHQVTLRSRHNADNTLSLECIETPEISDAEFPGIDNNLGLSPVADAFGDDGSPRVLSIIVGALDLAPIHTGTEKVFGRMLATSSIFGWLYSGTLRDSPATEETLKTLCQLRASLPVPASAELTCDAPPMALTARNADKSKASKDIDLNSALNFLWEGEFMGFDAPSDNEKDLLSQNMKTFFESTTVRLPDGRYELCLPFKENLSLLGDNEGLARIRLRSLIKNLRKKDGHLQAVDLEIKKSIEAGFAEEAAPIREGQLVHYLPLQAVFKYTADGNTIKKTRVVKDASSHISHRASLNDCLHQGDNLLPLIPQVLCAFRECRFPVTADIQNAFLQFQLHESNRSLLRFLWPIDISSNPDAPIKEFWSTRLEFGLSCSPWCHIMGVQHHLTLSMQHHPSHADFIQEVSQNLYMDDIIFRTDSVREAEKKITTLFEVFQSAHFPLKKWSTSNDDIANAIRRLSPVPDTEITSGKEDAKFLGVRWIQPSDEIGVFTEKALSHLRDNLPSKRNLLKAAAQIYDPLGLLSPVTIKARILFQSMWKLEIDWDQELPRDTLVQYDAFIDSLRRCSDFRAPRALASQLSAARFEIHSFCDSSLEAYACSIYLRTVLQSRTETQLIIAKARVAPLKNKGSIHRYELMGAVLAARMASQVEKFMKIRIDRTCYWIDNMACLSWIHSHPERWQPFVANRVRLIQQLTEKTDWFYVKSADNPSDIGSRGGDISSVENRFRWLHGPSWLSDHQWVAPTTPPPVEETSEEKRISQPHVFLVCSYNADNPIDDLINPQRFSSWSKLLRAQAFCNRLKKFAHSIQNRRFRGSVPARRATLRSSATPSLLLDPAEIAQAEVDLIKRIQARHFATELAHNCQNISNSSPLAQYQLFIDTDGLIRCRSRLERAKDLPYDAKFPIVIPNDNGWARLLVLYIHARDCWHWGGVAMTLQHLRKRYFVLKARRITTAALDSCIGCRKFKAKPAIEPTPALPKFRIDQVPPFFYCGIDFAGPIYYRAESARRAKGYILFFSCAVTRAIHIELTTDMSTYEVLRGLQKFLNQYPTAKNLYSDNGSYFHRADLELKLIYGHIVKGFIADWLSKNRLSWKFITPAAPWVGAFWERSIGSVKRCLRKVLGTSTPHFRDLEVILSGIQSIVNRRPLTAVSTDPDEPTALTPASLISGYQGDNMIPPTLDHPNRRSDIGAVCFSKRWIFQQRILAAFWERYRNEYLVYLRTAMQRKPVSQRSVKEGDVCLLKDDAKSRAFWPLVRVVELFKSSSDNLARSCSIKTANGNILVRPVKLLYPLCIESVDPLH